MVDARLRARRAAEQQRAPHAHVGRRQQQAQHEVARDLPTKEGKERGQDDDERGRRREKPQVAGDEKFAVGNSESRFE